MKTKLISAILLGAAVATPALAEKPVDPNVQEARQVIKQFFTRLKGELQSAMKAGGPVNAIEVCKLKAPKITAEVSNQTGWRVARTSLKNRSPANAPTAWEKKVLEDFEARKAAGADPKTLDHAEIAEVDGKRVFRYMKAIPTGQICLKCHGGKEVSPAVEARLKELYPNDKARGFKVGDIRGAFVLEKTL